MKTKSCNLNKKKKSRDSLIVKEVAFDGDSHAF